MRRVIWSEAAIADLRSIQVYIGMFDLAAARRLGNRLADAAEALVDFPLRGREIDGGLRQLSVIYPYLIRYRVTNDGVEIVSVRDGARDG